MKGLTRDQVVEAIKLHRGEIVEAHEWRPLADHVLELIKMAEIQALNVIADKVQDMILERRGRKSEAPAKRLFRVTHTYRHGTCFYLVRAESEPSEEALIKALEIDFEPEREETLEVEEVTEITEM